MEILAQSSTAFVLTHNFQGSHILGASRGRLSDSVASCCHLQGDHLCGKPVTEFETCQGNVRYFVNSQGIVREKSCHGEVSQNCSLLVEYLRSYGYLVASSYYCILITIIPAQRFY